MASGATPTIAEFEKYYSDQELGYPFIRVQNLTETGQLFLDDLKYINDYTHNVYLKRSQVKENDLLVKITGVGRMAVASVPPKSFEGNINQHSVVIKTTSREVSECLAAFLNSDVGEILASRRSTGGTRPALDYLALRSIPVVFDTAIFTMAKEARKRKADKEKEAADILAGMDDFFLSELGITLPRELPNTIEARSFFADFSKVSGNRFDPKKYSTRTVQLYSAIRNSHYPKKPLKDLLLQSAAGNWGDEPHDGYNDRIYTSCLVIRSTEFDNDFNLKLDNSRAKYRLISRTVLNRLEIKPFDILLEKSGGSPDQPVGRVALLTSEIVNAQPLCYSNFIHKFRVDDSQIQPEFAFAYLKAIHNAKLTDTMQSQTNGIRNLIMREYWNQNIPLPPINKQRIMAKEYFKMKAHAQKLLREAEIGFVQAQKEIKKIILS